MYFVGEGRVNNMQAKFRLCNCILSTERTRLIYLSVSLFTVGSGVDSSCY